MSTWVELAKDEPLEVEGLLSIYRKNNPDFLFHLDDNLTEVRHIYGQAKVLSISCWGNGAWYGKCLKVANQYLANHPDI